jgi:predicted NodU family carbamoyl transferase
VAQIVADGKLVGLVQGRMEFGIRSLGYRGIIGDPRRPDTRRRINVHIKGVDDASPCSSVSVDSTVSPFLRDVLVAVGRISGLPTIINEPFSTAHEPIVCSPIDAYRCMMHTHLDCIAMEDVLVWRHEQPSWDDGRS